jgi:hypothetical protein
MTDMRNEIMDGIAKVIIDKPIDEVAPVLVVAVARVLMIDGEGDKDKVAFSVAKFLSRLTETLNDMWEDEESADTTQRKLN